jgi:TonB-dependent receptor
MNLPLKRTAPVRAYRRTHCALAVAAAFAVIAPPTSQAQEATADGAQPAAVKPENIVIVAGTRRSVASAIDRKLKAGTVVDSIVAEDIGQFPDKNVGEALSRVTGVQLTREFGEGSTVSIRGVEPNLNRLEVNGNSVLSTDGTAGRGAELRELASELISSIDVYKGTTADLTEGGVGGTVIITTRKPLDFKKLTAVATAAAEKSSIRDGVQPRSSVFIADQFLDNRLGVMANLVSDNVHTRNDYVRNTSWTFLRDWDFSPDKTVPSTDPAVAAVQTPAGCTAASLNAAQQTACQRQWFDYAPQIPRYGQWQRDHHRSSAEFTAQFKVNKELMVYGSRLVNNQHEHLIDRNFATDFTAVTRLATAAGGTAPVYNDATGVPTKAGTCGAATTAGTPAGMVVANHYVTQYTVGDCLYAGGLGGQAAFNTQTRDYRLHVKSLYNTAGFEFKHDALEASGMVTRSNSHYDSDNNSVLLAQNAPGLVVKLDGQGLPHFTFPAGYQPDNPASYVQAQILYRPSDVKNTEDQVKLDLKYRLQTPLLTRLWFGARSAKSTAQSYGGGGYLANAGKLSTTADDVYVQTANITSNILYDPLYKGTAQRAADKPANIASLGTNAYVNAAQMAALARAALVQRSSGTFFQGYSGVSGLPSGWIAPGYAATASYFDTSHFNHDWLFNAPGSDGATYPQIPAFAVEEKTRAAYARADWETEVWGHDLRGNIGVRYVRTHENSAGLFKYQADIETAPGASTYTTQVISNSLVALDNVYHDWLPSFNAQLWLVPDTFLVRFGWGRVMARPAIDQLAPNVTCTKDSGQVRFGGDNTDDCTAGNPNLKPFRASETDLSFEYYPGKDSQLSAAVFRKDIKTGSPISTVVKGVDYFGDGQLWDVTMPLNAPGAKTDGLELAGRTALTFLPGFLNGFGVDVNYTRMKFKYASGTERINTLDGSVLPYPGLSKNSYNLGLWYDKGPINARIAYNYRDRYYTGGVDVSKNPIFIEKTGYLDAKIQYRYNDHVTFSLEGKNLSNQNQVQDAGDLFRVNEFIWSGRRYYFGVTIKT